jgi:hypothetical protein
MKRDDHKPNPERLAEIAALAAPALLSRINAIRGRLGYMPMERHGAFYYYGERGRHRGRPRAEVVEQCERLEAEEVNIVAEQAEQKLVERFQHSDIFNIRRHGDDIRDAGRHLQRLKYLGSVPRSVRMKVLAFVGLTDADLDEVRP